MPFIRPRGPASLERAGSRKAKKAEEPERFLPFLWYIFVFRMRKVLFFYCIRSKKVV